MRYGHAWDKIKKKKVKLRFPLILFTQEDYRLLVLHQIFDEKITRPNAAA